MPVKPLLATGFLCLLPFFAYAQSNEFTLMRILQKYTEDYGGFRDADVLSSLSVEGTIEQNGQTFDFLMRKKRPYAFRYRLTSDYNSAVTGYNGRQGWVRTESNGEISIDELEREQLDIIREKAGFDGPLFRHFEKDENDVSLIERDAIDGRPVYVIQVLEPRGRTTHYFLDAQNAHILRIDQIDDAGEISFQTFYRDYREVDGFPFAHEVETKVAGERTSLAKISEIRVNPGLLSFYFEKPKR